MPDGGRLRITVARAPAEGDGVGQAPAEPGGYVRVSVQDTGIGMTDEVKARMFDPFFTTKAPGKGSGLGLAMTYGLVKQQGGFIDVDTTPGKGTTMSLYFPIAEHGTAASSPRHGAGELPRGTETILLVEDEESLRRATQRVLERLGYRVLGAADGAEALEVFRTHRATIDLILSDVVMPRLGGVGLYQAIRREDAAVRFALITGYAERDVGRDGKLDPRVPLIFKPWTVPDLAQRVRQTLDRAA
jgi:CheY-like chemotaxis protein